MCGLTGFWSPNGFSDEIAPRATLQAMTGALAYRGPDSSGLWLDLDAGVALGHRRLAIVDLSSAGAQPMMSPSQRYVLSFNGEIYNHLSLRRELEIAGLSPDWRGRSDTETLLVAIERWGLLSTLQRCVGMFALALWDREERRLLLARDRFGEKPLYYGWVGAQKHFLFGSELKALKAHQEFRNPINREALAFFLRYSVVPAPLSIYTGIRKLRPGRVLVLAMKSGSIDCEEQTTGTLATSYLMG